MMTIKFVVFGGGFVFVSVVEMVSMAALVVSAAEILQPMLVVPESASGFNRKKTYEPPE